RDVADRWRRDQPGDSGRGGGSEPSRATAARRASNGRSPRTPPEAANAPDACDAGRSDPYSRPRVQPGAGADRRGDGAMAGANASALAGPATDSGAADRPRGPP